MGTRHQAVCPGCGKPAEFEIGVWITVTNICPHCAALVRGERQPGLSPRFWVHTSKPIDLPHPGDPYPAVKTDPERPVIEVDRIKRFESPVPPAPITINGKPYKLTEAEREKAELYLLGLTRFLTLSGCTVETFPDDDVRPDHVVVR